jgi:hypothetical protein
MQQNEEGIMAHIMREMRRIYHTLTPTQRLGMTVEQLASLAGFTYR